METYLTAKSVAVSSRILRITCKKRRKGISIIPAARMIISAMPRLRVLVAMKGRVSPPSSNPRRRISTFVCALF